ncbi:hypothetical protein IMZ31_23130 (plasmid) [Pontibacillus sp. ALD_SL1]|uniref:hypothetical protein n=1 Tax=Pontibacillus sp. ALD_SL1 TaxID=2777185 RepID=UPI001A979710|nr:hypothetical protein [Pontibacillus sp. ALD_SL1]QST02347.1 hypothetical protein IMZ31_23130 [Pontibacillus sp. ALD_SL1]
MENWDNYSFLYFLKETKEFQLIKQTVFHFYRFLSLRKNISWEKYFVVLNGDVHDLQEDLTISNLIHHKLMTTKGELTSEGERFIREHIETNETFMHHVRSFLKEYRGQTVRENTCYDNRDYYTMCCHLCKDPICVNLKISFQDIKEFIGYKGKKKPYQEKFL